MKKFVNALAQISATLTLFVAAGIAVATLLQTQSPEMAMQPQETVCAQA